MKGRNRVFYFVIFMAALTSAGCATMQNFQQNIVKSLRSPGETMVVNPEETELFHQCPEGRQGMPSLIETDTIPNSVKPGEEINHRIRYVLCLADQSAVLKGEIIRAVSYKDKTVFRDSAKYDFKPGIWTVDAFVLVPENATPGTYMVYTTLIFRSGSAGMSNTFQVKNIKEAK
jgi:hypothetical protein